MSLKAALREARIAAATRKTRCAAALSLMLAFAERVSEESAGLTKRERSLVARVRRWSEEAARTIYPSTDTAPVSASYIRESLARLREVERACLGVVASGPENVPVDTAILLAYATAVWDSRHFFSPRGKDARPWRYLSLAIDALYADMLASDADKEMIEDLGHAAGMVACERLFYRDNLFAEPAAIAA